MQICLGMQCSLLNYLIHSNRTSVVSLLISLNLQAGSLHFAKFQMKRNPRAYLETARHLSLPPARCAMVAAHMWDLRAAQKLGMKTIYVPRPGEDAGLGYAETRNEEEGVEVDFVVDNFEGIVSLVGGGH